MIRATATIAPASFDVFAYGEHIERLKVAHSFLNRLCASAHFESLRGQLEQALAVDAQGPGGRPGYDAVNMFKVLALREWYGLSDDDMEQQLWNRMDFQVFTGFMLGGRIPDAKTIWLYRERWTKKGTFAVCFAAIVAGFSAQGVQMSGGKAVDASFVEAPRQRNTPEENEIIKTTGTAPEAWKENENKLAQKDVDARWTKKGDQTYYGYKLHVVVDTLSKLILGCTATAASVHDSQVFTELLDPNCDKTVFADSAYSSAEILEILKNMEIEAMIGERGKRGHPLTDEQKSSNRQKSKIRARIEHVFGAMTNNMKGLRMRCIGITRAAALIVMQCILYNLSRLEFLKRPKKLTA